MRTRFKAAFQPSVERFEARIVAAGGLVSAAAHHVAAHHQAHESPHQTRHEATHQAASTASSPSTQTSRQTQTPTTPLSSLSQNTTTNQAWVELVNMTGQNLEYQIKLGPYANGQFLAFDIGAGQTEYQMSSLISNGQRVNADFAIQFGNGPVTPLNPGISQQSAQGYYIFMDDNFQYYVEPFVRS